VSVLLKVSHSCESRNLAYSIVKNYYVYILANKSHTTLYIGVTSDLAKRVWEHKNKVAQGFTQRYNLTHLVYYERYDDPENAILREKRLKKWKRKWKETLIEKMNPEWTDLYEKLF